jgi:hypothetical protein
MGELACGCADEAFESDGVCESENAGIPAPKSPHDKAAATTCKTRNFDRRWLGLPRAGFMNERANLQASL